MKRYFLFTLFITFSFHNAIATKRNKNHLLNEKPINRQLRNECNATFNNGSVIDTSKCKDFFANGANPHILLSAHNFLYQFNRRTEEDQITLISLFKQFKGNINYSFEGGLTLLHRAIYEHNPSLALLFLQYGASPNIANTRGYTPLHSALSMINANYDNMKFRKLSDELIKKNANLYTEYNNILFGTVTTPIMLALNHTDYFLNSTAIKDNLKSQTDNTHKSNALHSFIQHQNNILAINFMQATDMLIKYGADIKTKDSDDKTLYDLALEKNNISLKCHLALR